MKPFTTIAVIIFAVICVVHVLRLVFGWSANINGTEIPIWISAVGAIVSALISIMLWKENR